MDLGWKTYLIDSLQILAWQGISLHFARDYSFEKPIEIDDRLYFEDMAIYSFVKNNTFNGIGLPSLYLMDKRVSAV